MKFIDYGLSVLRRSTIVEHVPSEDSFDLSDLYTRLSLDGSLCGYEVRDRFYEIGSPAGLAELEAHLGDADRR
jgi:NDP-sugar pyrophosphorylase family protein